MTKMQTDKKLAMAVEKMGIGELLSFVGMIAQKKYAGHFTVFSFTTEYRVGFGTPNEKSRDESFTNVKAYPTLVEALRNAIINEPSW